MSFFTKKKKSGAKKTKLDSPSTLDQGSKAEEPLPPHTQSQSPTRASQSPTRASQSASTATPTSPVTTCVTQASSIFSGLHLTHSTTETSGFPGNQHVEKGISDCNDEKETTMEDEEITMEDGVEEDESSSSFSFLKATEVETVGSKEGVASSDLEEAKSSERSGGGFSFLDEPVVPLPQDLNVVNEEQVSHLEEDSCSTSQGSESHHSSATSTQDCDKNSTKYKPIAIQKCSGKQGTPVASDVKKKKRKAIRPGQYTQVLVPSTDIAATGDDVKLELSAEPLLHTDDTSQTSSQTSGPSSQTSGPSDQTSGSSDQTSDQTSAPSGQTSAPSSQTSAPSGQTSAPSDQTSAPSGQTSAPSDQTSGPPIKVVESVSVEHDLSTLKLESALSPVEEMDGDNFHEKSTALHAATSDSIVADSANARTDQTLRELSTNSEKYIVQYNHEESLSGLLQSYASGLAKLRNELLMTEELYKSQLSEHVGLAKQQVDRWLEEHLLREKEAKALAEEDYELAEQLSKRLDATGVKPEQDIVSTALTKIDQWIQVCNSTKENEMMFQEEMKSKLDALRKDHNSTLDDLKREHTSILAKEKMQIQSLVNKIEREAGHVALDCSHLEKREQLLKEEMSRRAVDFIDKKENLTTELTAIESEIDTFEVKLRLLREKKKEVVASIKIEEDHITNVEEELAEEKNQLLTERIALQKREDQLASQQKTLQEREEAIKEVEAKQECERQSLEDLVTQANSVWEEVQDAVSLKDQSNLQVKHLVDLLEDGRNLLKPSQELMEAQRVLEMKRKEVEEQTSKILTGQNELGELRRKVQSTQAQILQLLESKKAAVTGRQFKEASRLANESKSIGLVLEENKARLSDAEETMITSSKKLAELSDEHSKLRGELAKLEKNEDENHIQDLLQASSSLSSLLEVVGDFHLKSVVDVWNQLYLLLVESLCSKHGLDRHVTSGHKLSIETCECEVDTSEGKVDAVEGEVNQSSQLMKRVAELEGEIDKACQEENYDRAAELEEELQSIVNTSHDTAIKIT